MGYPSGPDASVEATTRALERVQPSSTVVLVEGISDQIAVETLAARLGLDLNRSGVVVVPMGGAQAIGKFTQHLAGSGQERLVLGLCDAAERRWFDRAAEHAPPAPFCTFVCDRDLEDELVRAVGEQMIMSLLDDHDDLGSFRALQKQQAWAGRPFDAQMHRWLRAGATRNLRYARLLIESTEPEHAPQPLLDLLDAACA